MKQTLAQSEIVSTFFHRWIMLHIKMNSWNHSTNVWAEFFFIRACFGFGSFPQLRYTIYVFQFTIKIFFLLLLFASLPSTYSLLTEKKVSIDLEDGFARFNLPKSRLSGLQTTHGKSGKLVGRSKKIHWLIFMLCKKLRSCCSLD